MTRIHRLLTLGSDDEPQWVKIFVRPIDARWAAMILGDEDQPPGPDELRGIALFGDTPEEAEQAALDYLGVCAERS